MSLAKKHFVPCVHVDWRLNSSTLVPVQQEADLDMASVGLIDDVECMRFEGGIMHIRRTNDLRIRSWYAVGKQDSLTCGAETRSFVHDFLDLAARGIVHLAMDGFQNSNGIVVD